VDEFSPGLMSSGGVFAGEVVEARLPEWQCLANSVAGAVFLSVKRDTGGETK
jgi:hypothetical protein